jgi:hypothetical protein
LFPKEQSWGSHLGVYLEAISKIVFGVFFSGEAAEKHTNPLVFEVTSSIIEVN